MVVIEAVSAQLVAIEPTPYPVVVVVILQAQHCFLVPRELVRVEDVFDGEGQALWWIVFSVGTDERQTFVVVVVIDADARLAVFQGASQVDGTCL